MISAHLRISKRMISVTEANRQTLRPAPRSILIESVVCRKKILFSKKFTLFLLGPSWARIRPSPPHVILYPHKTPIYKQMHFSQKKKSHFESEIARQLIATERNFVTGLSSMESCRTSGLSNRSSVAQHGRVIRTYSSKSCSSLP